MPRLKPKLKEQAPTTRADLVRKLADGVEYPDVSSGLLKDVPEGERAGLVEQALELAFTERAARRETILRERLENSSPEAWGMFFAESESLQDGLTDEQRERWDAWRGGTREPEPNPKLLTMPRPL